VVDANLAVITAAYDGLIDVTAALQGASDRPDGADDRPSHSSLATTGAVR